MIKKKLIIHKLIFRFYKVSFRLNGGKEPISESTIIRKSVQLRQHVTIKIVVMARGVFVETLFFTKSSKKNSALRDRSKTIWQRVSFNQWETLD